MLRPISAAYFSSFFRHVNSQYCSCKCAGFLWPMDSIWLMFLFICGVTALIRFHLKHKRTSSSSSSLDHPEIEYDVSEIKYDVFVSFRGPDTRSNFLGHLLEALSQKNIDYFVDDQNVKSGDEISSVLLNAIKKSEILLVLLSVDYASSKWCLEELEQIIQCMKNPKQIILPIFYKVDPSTVRHQRGSYSKAFGKLSEKYDKDRLKKWRAALNEVCRLSGFDSSNFNTEAILIKKIVERVLEELRKARNQNDQKGFVGIHKYVQYLETKLSRDSQDILTIGVWDMGGVGKTTITEILYNRLSYKYEDKHLLCVRGELEKGKSIRDLKKDLLSKLLGEVVHDVTINGSLEYVVRRLHRKKVLVILDDINELDHLEILIGQNMRFGPGSRIIITSRDKHIFSKGCDEIYVVKPLNFEDALQLFEKCLEKSSFEEQELKELSRRVVNYSKGVPLAIKVLGRFLYDKKIDEWKSKLEKLQKMPDSKIQEILELSYNGLDDDEHKDIFLYLACFFRNESREWITMLLDECGCHSIDGIRVLQDKALVSISNTGFVSMHELIRAMGCEIVRKNSPKDLSQRNHLMDPDDICRVFRNKMGMRIIDSIRVDISRLKKDIQLGPQAFARMEDLRLLWFHGQSENRDAVYAPEVGFELLPNELRSFTWKGFPSKYFPLRICVENIVELRFPHNKLPKSWEGVQDLPSLKVVDLFKSSELIELPNLSKAPNLKFILLQFCTKLRHVGLWPNQCKVELHSTEYQEYKMINNEESEEDDHLDLCKTSMPIKPSFKYYVCSSLERLNLSCCFRFTGIPDNVHLFLPSLKMLSITFSKVETLPASIKLLSQLAALYVRGGSRLRHIPELPPSIEDIDARDCKSLETVQFTANSMPLSHQKLQKHQLKIDLCKCIKLDDHELEAVARHYKLETQRIISAGIKDAYSSLSITRSKFPVWFSSHRVTRDSVSTPLKLPLHSKEMGLIFYFGILERKKPPHNFKIECHIELGNAPKVQFTYYPKNLKLRGYISNRVLFWYESTLSQNIMEEVSKIKASATIDDFYAKIWFKLLENVKEWGVFPVFISSKSEDLTTKCPEINDNDKHDCIDFLDHDDGGDWLKV